MDADKARKDERKPSSKPEPAATELDAGSRRALESAAPEPAAPSSTTCAADPQPQLKLACPRCAAWGMISVANLGHFFYCRRCDQWYRTENSAFVRVRKPPMSVNLQVRTGFSAYHNDRYRDSPTLNRRERLGLWLLRFKYRLATAAVVLIVAVVISFSQYRPANAEKLDVLPSKLEDRVPVWIHAWYGGDVPRLMQLSAPSYDRQLRQWVSHNRPPKDCDKAELQKAEITLTSLKSRGKMYADVTAEIHATDTVGQPKKFVVEQTWITTNGVWYYLPPLPAKKKR